MRNYPQNTSKTAILGHISYKYFGVNKICARPYTCFATEISYFATERSILDRPAQVYFNFDCNFIFNVHVYFKTLISALCGNN